MATINVIKLKNKPVVIHYRAFEKCFRMQYVLPYAGAAHEKIPGLAHATEHMLVFNKLGNHNIANEAAATFGVNINAFTGFAMAGLDASGVVSTKALDEVARQWSAQLVSENYTQENWNCEKEIIRAEALDADNTAAFIDVFMRAVTRTSPRYKQGVMIGTDFLDGISVADLRKAHQNWNTWGDQSFVLIVGDLCPEDINRFMTKMDFGNYNASLKVKLDKSRPKAYDQKMSTWSLANYTLSGIEARRYHFMEASGPLLGTQAWYDMLAIGGLFFTGGNSKAHKVLRGDHGICYDCGGLISRVDGGVVLGIEYAMEKKLTTGPKDHELLSKIVKQAASDVTPEAVKMIAMNMKTNYCLIHNSIEDLVDALGDELTIMSYETTLAEFQKNAKLLTLDNRLAMLDNLNVGRLQHLANRFSKSKYTVHYFTEKCEHIKKGKKK